MDIDYEELDNRFNDSNATTFADYQNFRNVLFQLSQEFNNATGLFIACRDSQYNIHKKIVIEIWLKLYPQIRSKNMQTHITPYERKFLVKFYNEPIKINRPIARILNQIMFKLMDNFGVYNISKATESYR